MSLERDDAIGTTGYLQIAEIAVYGAASTTTNIALSQPVYTSGTYGSSYVGGKLVDGSTGTFSITQDSLATDVPNTGVNSPYMMIALGNRSDEVGKIVVTARVDCCASSNNNAWLRIREGPSKKMVWQSQFGTITNGQVLTYNFNVQVGVSCLDGGTRYLNLGDIQAYTTLNPTVNAATTGTVLYSSIYSPGTNPASNINDGNINTWMSTNNDVNSWIAIDMGGVGKLNKVVIVNRQDAGGANVVGCWARIFVSGNLMWQSQLTVQQTSWTFYPYISPPTASPTAAPSASPSKTPTTSQPTAVPSTSPTISPWTEVGKFTISGLISTARVGNDVAMSRDGSTIFTSAITSGPTSNGGWGIYKKNFAGTWTLQKSYMYAAPYDASVQQGSTPQLSTNGSFLLYGTSGNGAGYFYPWTQLQKGYDTYTYVQSGTSRSVPSFAPTTTAQYNTVMNSDGTFVCASAPALTTNTGYAACFNRTDFIWTEFKTKFTGTSATTGSYFGSSMAMTGDGTRLVIAGYGHSSSVGAFWAYNCVVQTSCTEIQGPTVMTSATGGSQAGQFSTVLSDDGMYLVLGAPQDNSGVGAVFVYRYNGTQYVFSQKLTQTSSGVGYRVCISGDGTTLGVGASCFSRDLLWRCSRSRAAHRTEWTSRHRAIYAHLVCS